VNYVQWPDWLLYVPGTFVALFPIANLFGATSIFYALTAHSETAERRRQACWTAIYAVLILAVTLVAGELVLAFFGISLNVVRIAGGLIIGATAWEMVTAHERLTAAETDEAAHKHQIAFTPMALPLISGPGAMGVVIGLAADTTNWGELLGCLLGIGLLGLATYLCLVAGEPITRALGKTGMGALTRVLGFLLLALAVQLVAEGVLGLVHQGLANL
jgi:multiple antibiotic resistance protein